MKIKRLLVLLLVPVCMLTGCSKNTITVTEENALTVCLDEAGISEENIENVHIEKKSGFTVEFDYKNKHYIFRVSSKGLIRSRRIENNEVSTSKTETKSEETKSEPTYTEAEKNIINSALSNAGVSEKDVTDITCTHNQDGTYTVKFKIDGSTLVTVADAAGTLTDSYYE